MIQTSHFEGILFHLGGLAISGSVVMSWLLIGLLTTIAWFSSQRLKTPLGIWQTILEGTYSAMSGAVNEVVGDHSDQILPFVGALWIFILSANLMGIIPGLGSPTSDLSVTAALAILVFCSVHWFGWRVFRI